MYKSTQVLFCFFLKTQVLETRPHLIPWTNHPRGMFGTQCHQKASILTDGSPICWFSAIHTILTLDRKKKTPSGSLPTRTHHTQHTIVVRPLFLFRTHLVCFFYFPMSIPNLTKKQLRKRWMTCHPGAGGCGCWDVRRGRCRCSGWRWRPTHWRRCGHRAVVAVAVVVAAAAAAAQA